MNQDLVTGMPKAIRRAMDGIRKSFPSTLVMRMLMVGCSAGEGHLVRDNTTGSVEWVAQALSEALQPVARGFKAAINGHEGSTPDNTLVGSRTGAESAQALPQSATQGIPTPNHVEPVERVHIGKRT